MLSCCKLCGQPLDDLENKVVDSFGVNFEIHAKCFEQSLPPILLMVDHAKEFVRRVEAGEVRSRSTYAKFKDALSRIVSV